jgi:hypothetical protein
MESERPKTSIRRPSAVPLVLVGLGIVAAAAGGLWWFLGKAQPPPPAGASAPAAVEEPAPATGPSVDPGRQRSLLEAVSTNALLRGLLLAPEAARRWAVAVENLANDVVPRKQLEPLAPAGTFSVVRRGGAAFIDPRSYERFDAVGDAVASVNVDAFVIAYAALRPPLEAAYRALGYPDGSIDKAAARALHRIEISPVRDGEVAVVEGTTGATWAYADPTVEGLGDVERQILRMGPRNGRILQAKAREISQALGMGAPGK